MLTLARYSIGMGDRFAHQAEAQLRACMAALEAGVEVIPVWNKSNREHSIIGSEPQQVRQAADQAVARLGWTRPYHVDADHIRLETVPRFLSACDFFTIDVADSIGQQADSDSIEAFVRKYHQLPGNPFPVGSEEVRRIAWKYLKAVQDAAAIYRTIAQAKGEGNFITEVSMDETDSPQTPAELLLILAALAEAGVPVQTIAPKFTGRFNKGIDYRGNLEQFELEFRADLTAIAYAIHHFGLPANLKLSVHSGSDKFSLYPIMRKALRETGVGLHLKTAGTTWLEELIGLAEAGDDGLTLVKEIYAKAVLKMDELCVPYASVIDINTAQLPSSETVASWNSQQFVEALRHDPSNPAFNPSVRQLLHVGFKIAAQMGQRYLEMLQRHETIIARNVTHNLYDRHIRPLFVDRAT